MKNRSKESPLSRADRMPQERGTDSYHGFVSNNLQTTPKFEHDGLPGIQLLTIERVASLLCLSRSATYELIKSGHLPRPIKLSASADRRASARWYLHEVMDAIQKMADARIDF